MGLLDWLIPSKETKLARARELISRGKLNEARSLLLGVEGEEAELLFAQAEALCEAQELRESPPGSKGFWIEVRSLDLDNERRHRFIRLLKEELARTELPVDYPYLRVRAVTDEEKVALERQMGEIVDRTNRRLAVEVGDEKAQCMVSLEARTL